MKELNTKKGFTLIEVILVLAIAAMIFLMVLLTLPAVQRSQRDMQRKQDLGKVISAWNSYISNNNKRPDTTLNANNGGICEGARGEMQPEFCQLDTYVSLTNGQTYSILDGPASGSVIHQDATAPNATQDNIAVYRKAVCSGSDNGDILPGDSLRQIAVVVQLEAAGAEGIPIYYCQDDAK